MPAKTVKNSAAELDTRRFWHCPVCGVWAQTDSDGNVADHFSTYGSCPGSGEPTAFTVSALSEEGQEGLPVRVVELAKSVVRARRTRVVLGPRVPRLRPQHPIRQTRKTTRIQRTHSVLLQRLQGNGEIIGVVIHIEIFDLPRQSYLSSVHHN